MSNKHKPRRERDRRATLEAMRREQQSRERRKSILFIGAAVVVAIGLIAAVAVPSYLKGRNDPAKQALGSFGVAESAADCAVPVQDKIAASTKHVRDGTNVEYAQVPPSSGSHWAKPASLPREIYTADDRPAIEQLVHNLEHGYTILWYDGTVQGEQLQALKDISKRARTEDATGGKFRTGTHVALSHWGAKAGYRQLCGKVSGDVVASFIKKYPVGDSPEPSAG